MYEHIIHYCFTLSEEQLEYLRSKKYKMTHFSQILYYKPEGKLIFFEKSALQGEVRGRDKGGSCLAPLHSQRSPF